MAEKSKRTFQALWTTAGNVVWSYFPAALSVVAWVGALFGQKLLWPMFWMVRPALRVRTVEANVLGLLLIGIAFWSFILNSRANSANAHLRAENDDLRRAAESMGSDYYDIWHHILALWARQLGFSGNERISLYKHSDGRFLMIGRFSLNPVYDRRGRGVYSAGEGCVGKAWSSRDGTCFATAFPDPLQSPDDYVQSHHDEWGLSEEAARSLAMKSRSILAMSVNDNTDTRRQAIVVYESMDQNGINLDQVSAFHGDTGRAQVALFMEALKSQEPSLELARREGF